MVQKLANGGGTQRLRYGLRAEGRDVVYETCQQSKSLTLTLQMNRPLGKYNTSRASRRQPRYVAMRARPRLNSHLKLN